MILANVLGRFWELSLSSLWETVSLLPQSFSEPMTPWEWGGSGDWP